MGKVLTVRVDDDLAGWAEGYAAKRGATRAQVHEAALRGFRELCASGVPELPPAKSGGRPKSDDQAPPVKLVERRPDIAAIRAKAAANAAREKAERERKYAERGW